MIDGQLLCFRHSVDTFNDGYTNMKRCGWVCVQLFVLASLAILAGKGLLSVQNDTQMAKMTEKSSEMPEAISMKFKF